MSKIRNFINDNNLSFAEGNRNTTITTLVGYSQYLELSKEDLLGELSNEIKADNFIEEEVERLWYYCKINNYKEYWVSRGTTQYTY